MEAADEVDLLIVGAGFAGLQMLHHAGRLGLDVRCIEAAGGVGGTWYWNRYPGARCDVESMQYSYQFDDELQQDWHWTERYAPQGEILRYLEHVADRYDLRRQITFGTRVTSAEWDEEAARWTVQTDNGHSLRPRFLVMATGCLSSTNRPDFPGLAEFPGAVYHTGEWPHEGVDFSGKRVAVIGTGSSAVQSIPIIAEQAEQLTVFQRTATYSVPAHNGPLDPEVEAAVKADYAEFRRHNAEQVAALGAAIPSAQLSVLEVDDAEREAMLDARWQQGGLTFSFDFVDTMLSPEANERIADYVRQKIRDIVDDPATAELLCPKQVIGAKRLCVDTGYYATFNRPNVTLVDVSEHPIESISAAGPVVDGVEYPVDCIVLATGFDAMTGTLLRIDVKGVDGRTLADAWSAGPRTYLGLMVAGFPNLFTISGPGSPSVLTNMAVSIDQHVRWITACLDDLRTGGYRRMEAEEPAQDAWVDHVNTVASFTLFPEANSWYLGANVPGKPRVFMPLLGFPDYAATCDDVAANGYRGFRLSS